MENLRRVTTTDNAEKSRSRQRRKKSQKPIVKVSMDLENNKLHVLKSVPPTRKKPTVDRSILKRSLS